MIAADDPISITSFGISPTHDTIVIGGKRMIYYSTEAVTSSIKSFN